MEARTRAQKKLMEIREGDRLGHLLKRPRCRDGGLDMRCKANRGFGKHANMTDFYDPKEPDVNVGAAVI